METSSTADTALVILLLLRDRGPLRLNDLTTLTKGSRTSISRLLTTLESRGFVHRADKAFVLGSVMATFGDAVSPSVRRAASRPLADLSAACDETAVLALREGQFFVVIDQVVSQNRIIQVQYTSEPSQLLTVAAHGRAILAHLDQTAYRQIRDAHLDPAWLDDQCEQIRADHLAASSGELEDGVAGAASVITDHRGQAVASIGIIAPSSRADLSRWHDLVSSAAAAVTSELALETSH